MSSTVLDREEYIEQAYFFRVYRERQADNVPSQEILTSINEEILATTKLPMAIEFLTGEIVLNGRISDGMALLSHYFTPFQTFVMAQSEDDYTRFDQRTGLLILQREAEYRAQEPTESGLFIFHFECISRNKLGFDAGMTAIAADPLFDEHWSDWILQCRRKLGTVDFADLICSRSEHFVDEKRRLSRNPDYQAPEPVLFGAKEGRIAAANRGRDPLYMFAALQRQLGYPSVPRPRPADDREKIIPQLQETIKQLDKRLTLVEREIKGDLDISEFYAKPPGDGESPPAGPIVTP